MSTNNFSLASWRNKKLDTGELRRSDRTPVDDWQATLFIDEVILLNNQVINSSYEGASLLLEHHEQDIALGAELTLTIDTGHRKFTRKAEVRWFSKDNDELRLGIQYLDHANFSPDIHKLDVEAIRIDPSCAMRVPATIAMRRKLLPFVEANGTVHVATAGQLSSTMLGSIERMIKAPLCLWDVDAEKLDKVLKRVYGNALNQPAPLAGKKKTAEEEIPEIVELANELLTSAYLRQASDIHVDPTPKGANIRFRVDGQLELYDTVKPDLVVELASRLKVMAGLDIAEKRSPQDGRFRHILRGGAQKIDLRVATLPTRYGERITMRLLASQENSLTLDQLGFTPAHKYLVVNFLKRIQGMMILTGPTGSGKTTTLYSAINMLLNDRAVNIMTVEDPIEYEIAGAAQCEIDANSDKVSFNSALRSILRHDPDVVMIGEIRDKETADIAIKAALTGHMVLSTLHTNSAAATVTRLIDMGVEPYLVAAALRLSVAQRLLRRLCKHCCIPRPLTELEAISINRQELKHKTVYDPVGCIYCNNKGYSGRIGLYELLELRTEWARAVAEGEPEEDLVAKMRAAGVKSLLEDATDKMMDGLTSYDEVLQVASSW